MTTTIPSTDRPEFWTATSRPEAIRRTAGLIAGVGYVALFALGIFANFIVREGPTAMKR